MAAPLALSCHNAEGKEGLPAPVCLHWTGVQRIVLGTDVGYQEQYKFLSLEKLSKTDIFPPWQEAL